jgi:electron transport complex protein RnfD
MSFLATAGLLAWIFGGDGFFNGDPIVHLFSGGMMLGVFFMATDYVTAPNVRKAQVIFGVGCGALTMLIRLKGGYPEGVMFAILLMNCFAPMLDRKYRTKTFGERKEEVAK